MNEIATQVAHAGVKLINKRKHKQKMNRYRKVINEQADDNNSIVNIVINCRTKNN